MTLTEQDRLEIAEIINRHGHLVDSGDLDELESVFTPDVVYDLADFNRSPIVGVGQMRQAALELGDRNPVAHHVTNIIITSQGSDRVFAQSKGIAVNVDGSCGSVVYEDALIRTPHGWRIHSRTVVARRKPLSR